MMSSNLPALKAIGRNALTHGRVTAPHSVGFLASSMISVSGAFPFLGAVRVYALRDCIAVNAESFGGVRNALLVPSERFLNIELFELFQSFVQHYVTIEHIFYDCFQAGAYLHLSPVLFGYQVIYEVGQTLSVSQVAASGLN